MTQSITKPGNQTPDILRKKWVELIPAERKTYYQVTLNQNAASIQKLLPPGVDLNYFIQAAVLQVSKQPKLLDCTFVSLVTATMQCAILGLVPDSLFGEAYLIPFNTNESDGHGGKRKVSKVNFIVGYKGLKKLAINTGEITDISVYGVWPGDKFKPHITAEKETFEYEQDYEADRKLGDPDWVYQNLRGVIAVSRFRDGHSKFIFMSKNQIEARRKRSSSQSSWDDAKRKMVVKEEPVGVWLTDYYKMAEKSAIRELCSQLQLSTSDKRVSLLQRAVELDEYAEVGLNQKVEANMQPYVQQLAQESSSFENLEMEVTEAVEAEAEYEAMQAAEETQRNSGRATSARADAANKTMEAVVTKNTASAKKADPAANKLIPYICVADVELGDNVIKSGRVSAVFTEEGLPVQYSFLSEDGSTVTLTQEEILTYSPEYFQLYSKK